MTAALGLVVGFLAARLAWLALRTVFATDVFARQNYRDHSLPTAVGLVLAAAVLAVEGLRVVAATVVGHDSILGGTRLAVLVLVVSMALLGIVDDLAGDGDRRGFRGHVQALRGGRLTTGALKLLGGGAAALVAVAAARPETDIVWLLLDGALVALAANTGNLFDRAPGRTIKVTSLLFGVLLAGTGFAAQLGAPAIVIGGGLALLLDDLHERVMLGDTGANVLGGIAGLGVVATSSPTARLAVLAVLAILNGISEYVSFSRVIDGFAPLRVLDRAGRRKE